MGDRALGKGEAHKGLCPGPPRATFAPHESQGIGPRSVARRGKEENRMPPWDSFQDHPHPKTEGGPPCPPPCCDARPFIQQTLRALPRVYTVRSEVKAVFQLGCGLSVGWDQGLV